MSMPPPPENRYLERRLSSVGRSLDALFDAAKPEVAEEPPPPPPTPPAVEKEAPSEPLRLQVDIVGIRGVPVPEEMQLYVRVMWNNIEVR
jgi:hypothetical protein